MQLVSIVDSDSQIDDALLNDLEVDPGKSGEEPDVYCSSKDNESNSENQDLIGNDGTAWQV